MNRGTTPRAKPIRAGRLAAVWLAVTCVYLQLLVGAFCPHTAHGATTIAHGPFPICHSWADNGSHGQTHDESGTDSCPLCALHCHSAVALVPAIEHPLRVAFASVTPDRALVSVAARPRRIAGASPRGPPLPLRTI